jgi:hypothetical protein
MTAPAPLTQAQAQAAFRAAFPHDPNQPCTCAGYPNCPITQLTTCTGHLVGCYCDLDFTAYQKLVIQIYEQGGTPEQTGPPSPPST